MAPDQRALLTIPIQSMHAQDLNGVAASALAAALLPAQPRAAAVPPAASQPRQGAGAGAAAASGAARALGPVPFRPLGELTTHLTCHPR